MQIDDQFFGKLIRRNNTPPNRSKAGVERKVQLFTKNITVESSSDKSSQAVIFFGRETSLGIRVVLKQYNGVKMRSILSEIKVFTLLEQKRQDQAGSELKRQIGHGSDLQGLPQMLAYKSSKHFSEILMTHCGNSLEKWKHHIKQPQMRMHFAADMLRQIIPALKTLHGVGYSHGDLKPENICARKNKEGQVKFTMIDFGICQKLPKIG